MNGEEEMRATASESTVSIVFAALQGQLPAAMEFDAETPLFEGGIELTSLRLLRVLMAIEDRLGFELADDEIVGLEAATVGDLCQVVEQQRQADGSAETG
jgi:acyl carrier protein